MGARDSLIRKCSTKEVMVELVMKVGRVSVQRTGERVQRIQGG